MSVDESIVIFGPIDQVGWARASSTVTSASSAFDRPRNGPPDAVSTMRLTQSPRLAVGVLRAQALVDGAVLAVDRHQLTRARLRPHPTNDRSGRDQRLLVGQREPRPRGRARPA